MAKIFISYAHEDLEKAEELYQRLKDSGFNPWMDRVDLLPGKKWRPAIEKAIKNADFFILCVSTHSITKRSFVQREIRTALDLWQERLEEDIYLIPALIEPIEHTEIPDEVAEFQSVELYREHGWEQLSKALQFEAARRGISLKAAVPAESNEAKPAAEPAPLEERTRSASTRLPPPKVTFDYHTIKLDMSGKEIERTKKQARCFSEDLGDGVNLVMVEIPGGTFMMGSPDSEADRRGSEGLQHQVTVPSFFIEKHQVTQAQWRAVMKDDNPSPSVFNGDNLPVESVSWNDAREFCSRLEKSTGRAYRLPSEAEWEYACRADPANTTPFSFGATITPSIVNYDGNYPYASAKKGEYREQTVPVGSLGVANAFGLFDMHGNVWEWCEDTWHGDYNGAPTDGSAWTSGGNQSWRVLRGGSWYNFGVNCRSACRVSYEPGVRNDFLGFRVVVVSRTP